jgi:hypothetical protein
LPTTYVTDAVSPGTYVRLSQVIVAPPVGSGGFVGVGVGADVVGVGYEFVTANVLVFALVPLAFVIMRLA